MGITVFFRGRLESPDLAGALVDEIKDICETMSFEHTLFTDAAGARTGIAFTPAPGCESVPFVFDPEGRLRQPGEDLGVPPDPAEWIHVKTQFGKAEAHVTLVKLLRYVKKRYAPQLEVLDETGFWRDEDLPRLREAFSSTRVMLHGEAPPAEAQVAEADARARLLSRLEDVLRRLAEGGADKR